MTLYVPPPDPPAFIQPYVKNSARDVPSSLESLISSQKFYVAKNEDRSPVNVADLGLRFPKTEATHLTAQERQGEKKEFEIPLGDRQNNTSQQPNSPANIEKVDVVEVVANQQQYDDRAQVITARGNVVMRFAQATLTADRLQINLVDRLAVAQGNVVLKRGEQVIRGARFEYYFVQDRGKVISASGEVYQPSLARDASPTSPVNEGTGIVPGKSLSDRLSANQPLRRVSGANGYQFVVGSQRDFNLLSGRGGISNPASGGIVNRLRFQADTLDFEGNAWTANKIRITNDPFSPPELEVRADTAKFRPTEPQVNRLNTKGSRVVLDQKAKVPLLFANDLTFDRRIKQPSLFRFAFDGEDRGGLFIERGFKVINRDDVSWKIKPQYFLQRAISNGDWLGASVWGLDTEFNAVLDSRSDLVARTSISGFEADKFKDNIRANVTLARKLGDLNRPYDLKFEYGYRERFFNSSLGFQTVRSRFGVQIDSPDISIADTGIRLKFLGSIQNITAEDQSNDLINLTRYLVSATVNKDFPLWQGKALPATKEEGLRFTSTPVLPYLQLITGLTGTENLYSNGDNQPLLRANIGIEGQFGHFSRSYLDYTGFRVEYAQGIVGDLSPFKFDRFVDKKTISVGIIQQIYGPIRAGIQTSWGLNDRAEISTDYILEYSRRTYKVVLRYNAVLAIGSISFNISDFNWEGNPEPFDNSDI